MKTKRLLLLCLTGAFLTAGWIVPVSAQEMDEDDDRPAVRQRGSVQRGEGGRPQRGRPAETRAENAQSETVAPLTADEIRTLRQMIAAFQARQGGPAAQAGERPAGRPARPGGGDEAGPPQGRGMSPEMRQRMLERFDTDGDGVLSPEERRVARETMQRERQERTTEGQ